MTCHVPLKTEEGHGNLSWTNYNRSFFGKVMHYTKLFLESYSLEKMSCFSVQFSMNKKGKQVWTNGLSDRFEEVLLD